eukprot:scaffold3208_cov402-Prasinococcus_capsulatus_cf.AAC.10
MRMYLSWYGPQCYPCGRAGHPSISRGNAPRSNGRVLRSDVAVAGGRTTASSSSETPARTAGVASKRAMQDESTVKRLDFESRDRAALEQANAVMASNSKDPAHIRQALSEVNLVEAPVELIKKQAADNAEEYSAGAVSSFRTRFNELKYDYKELGAKENFLLRLRGDVDGIEVDPEQADSLQNEIVQQKEELRGIKTGNADKIVKLNSLAQQMFASVDAIQAEKGLLEEKLRDIEQYTDDIRKMEEDINSEDLQVVEELEIELEQAKQALQEVVQGSKTNDTELEELKTFVTEAKHAAGELQMQLDRLIEQDKSEQAAEKVRSTMKPSEMQQWYEQMVALLESISGVTLMNTTKDLRIRSAYDGSPWVANVTKLLSYSDRPC